MNITFSIWLLTVALILGLLLFDLLTSTRKAHDVSFKEATFWSVFYIAVAVIFGIWVWADFGTQFGKEYFAAYIVEKSLSMDNLFVFIIILSNFAVPTIYHQRVLMVGIILALIMRAIFIAIGAAALEAFAFTFVIFGAVLLWTGIKLMQHWDEDPDLSENPIVNYAQRKFNFTDKYHGTKLFIKENGKRFATPLLLVMIAIGATDLLFALDSIPATFGVTQEPFLVFAANAFALLGLRALYFLMKNLVQKLIYFSLGLSFILVFIGIKLMLLWAYEEFDAPTKISTNISLIVIGSILAISTIASLIKSKRDPSAVAHAGRMSDPKKTKDQ
ncbi:MAG: TerC/Alx family metal homeostasis membrane protein [Actinomycetales bacterium]|nr:TerC/Alx family metal homeostasis membrane protein [Actinomycetales bacterium]